MDRGAYALLADAKPPFEQGLRAAGAEQRDVHRGGHDPPDTEAAGGGSVNLAKHALTSLVGPRCCTKAPDHAGAFSCVLHPTCKTALFRSGRCWVRTSDPLLIREARRVAGAFQSLHICCK